MDKMPHAPRDVASDLENISAQLKEHANWQMRVDTTEKKPSEAGLAPDDIAYNMWLEDHAQNDNVAVKSLRDVRSEKQAELRKENMRELARLGMRVKTGQASGEEAAYYYTLKEAEDEEASPFRVLEHDSGTSAEPLAAKSDEDVPSNNYTKPRHAKDVDLKASGKKRAPAQRTDVAKEVTTKIEESGAKKSPVGGGNDEGYTPVATTEPEVYRTTTTTPEKTTSTTQTSESASREKLINIRDARTVTAAELVRAIRNDGKELDKAYIENQIAVRQILANGLENGSLYASPENFRELLEEAHRAAAANDVYNKVGDGGMRFTESEHGVMRDQIHSGRIVNGRVGEAKFAAGIAEEYDDPYSDRFSTSGQIVVALYGIDEDNLPYDSYSSGRYEYCYAPSEALDQYLAQAQKIGTEITDALQAEEINQAAVVRLVGEQFQYMANARPFQQINNSLFMNLVNMQLRAAGVKPVPHGALDTVSHHLQPENFVDYFEDYVMDSNKGAAGLTAEDYEEDYTDLSQDTYHEDYDEEDVPTLNERQTWIGRKIGGLLANFRKSNEVQGVADNFVEVDDERFVVGDTSSKNNVVQEDVMAAPGEMARREVKPKEKATAESESPEAAAGNVTQDDLTATLSEVYGEESDARYLGKVLADDLKNNDDRYQKIEDDAFQALLKTMRNDVAFVQEFQADIAKTKGGNPTTRAYIALTGENKMGTLRKRWIRDTLMTRTKFMNTEQYNIFMKQLNDLAPKS